MLRTLKIFGYIAISIVLILLAPKFAYFFSPFLAIVHRTALVLSALFCVLGLPIRAYAFAVDIRKDPADRYLAIVVVVWLVCAVTQPNVTKQETFTVYGITAEYREQATAEFKCHCLVDAKATARRLYKDRKDWSRNEEGKFEVCDVKITEFTVIPRCPKSNALRWSADVAGLSETHGRSIDGW